jgi:hypothetical protein
MRVRTCNWYRTAVFQTRRVPSLLAVTARLPSGAKAADITYGSSSSSSSSSGGGGGQGRRGGWGLGARYVCSLLATSAPSNMSTVVHYCAQ